MADAETPARQEFQVSLSTIDKGKIHIKMFDRINVDDVFAHLVHREVFRILTGVDAGVDIPALYKEYLLRPRFTTGQS